MNAKTASDNQQKAPASRQAHNGGRGDLRHEPAGMDLPVFGHVPYQSIGFLTALGVAGVAGVIEWPVAAAVGVGYALARRASR